MKIQKDKIKIFLLDESVLKQYDNIIDTYELFSDNNTPQFLLEIIKRYFRLTEEEIHLYNERFKLDNSIGILNSRNISNSQVVINSDNINKSSYIFDCQDINNSSHIYNSRSIDDSKQVWESNNISDSFNIVNSVEIESSENVAQSDNIKWSEAVNLSSQLDNCQYMYRCVDVINSLFCGFVNHSNNCIFCNNGQGYNNMIFNKPVNTQTFILAQDKLMQSLLQEQSNFIQSYNDSNYKLKYKNNFNFSSLFDNLSSDFFGIVSTLPNFDEKLFMEILFR